MKPKKVPLRKRGGMPRNDAQKAAHSSIVKTPEDEVLIDLTGKKSGRGAYLCGKESCF